MAAGSGSQLASTNCAAIRQMKAKAMRWNRFETKIATSSAILAPFCWNPSLTGKNGAVSLISHLPRLPA